MTETTQSQQAVPARARRPIVIAHRGASGYVPEHTLTSYFIAIQQGADYIEPDLVCSRDGVLIARHENEIGGTTDVAEHAEFAHLRTRKVIDGTPMEGWFTEDFTLAQLKTLRARERIAALRPANARFDGQFEVPTFDEILDLVRGIEAQQARAAQARGQPPPRRIGIYPETKHPSYFAACQLGLELPLLDALARHGYEGADAPVFIQSFEVGNLRRLRQMSRIPLVQLMAASGGPHDLEPAPERYDYAAMAGSRGLAQVATYACAIGVEKTLVIARDAQGALGRPTTLVADAHAAGLLVHAWTFRAENHFLPLQYRAGTDPAGLGDICGEVQRHLAAGVDGFFIDQPAFGVRARDAASKAAGSA